MSCCKDVQGVSSMKDSNRLSLRDNHIWLIFLQLHQMLYAIKQATYKQVYNDVKNLGQILSCCKCIQCLQWKIQNVYLWEIITFDLFSYNSTKCYIRINKQLINLVYNDMKNLTYSLICFNCVQSVFWNIDRKALSAWDDHIDSFFTTTRKCFLRINKQLINLDYDDMKNLT